MNIKIDQHVAGQLAQKGITEKVGVYGDHKVKIGEGSPIKLNAVKSNSIPFQGFRTATKIERGKDGLQKSADQTIKTLCGGENFNVKVLLQSLKTNTEYLSRLQNLKQIPVEQQTVLYWMMASSVESISNSELANLYQNLNSAEMTLLQTALKREGEINRKAEDSRFACKQLSALETLVMQELNNRVSNGIIDDLIAKATKDWFNQPETEIIPREVLDKEIASYEERRPKLLTEQYGSVRYNIVRLHENDISVHNLHTLVNVAAESATRREKTAESENAKMQKRGISATTREIGDLLRKSPLTINLYTEVLLTEDAFVLNPDQPYKNAYHLTKDRKSKVTDEKNLYRDDSYMRQRTAVENLVFSELKQHAPVANERPVYAALNTQNALQGAAGRAYGSTTIVLKPEVARRATFIADDTFYSPAITITNERRAAFYALLGTSGLSAEVIVKMRNPESEGHAYLEAWFDALAKESNLTAMITKCMPENVRHSFIRNVTDETNFNAVFVQAFGDSKATRAKMTTYDNIESLLPGLDDLNGSILAAGVERKNKGMDGSVHLAMNYIEAQLHGPLVPSRDIQEVRVDLDALLPKDKQAECIRRMDEFHDKTGVKVVYVSSKARSELNLSKDAEYKQLDLNEHNRIIDTYQSDVKYYAGHIRAEAKQILDDACKDINIQKTLRELVNKNNLQDSFPSEGDILPQEGTMFAHVYWRLAENFKAEFNNFSDQHLSPKDVVDHVLKKTFLPTLKRKAAILDKLKTLEMNDAQRACFTSWVLRSKVKTPEECEMIFDNARVQAQALRKIATENPPLSANAVLSTVAEACRVISNRTLAYVNSLGENAEYGTDDKWADYERSVSLGFSLACNAADVLSLDQVRVLNDRMNAPDVKNLIGHLDCFVGEVAKKTAEFADKTGFGNLNMLNLVLKQYYKYTARNLNKDVYSLPEFGLNPSLVPVRSREIFESLISDDPTIVNVFNTKFPPHTVFPSARNPAELPNDSASARAFLVRHLDGYLAHEETFDEMGVHGRGHIARSYIFASAMCNILEEQGVPVDRAAVLCGITAHDIERKNNGEDFWEEQSAAAAVALMTADYGVECMDEIYGAGVRHIISDKKHETPESDTVEAMILQGADSLDIGRVTMFDIDRMTFLAARDGEEMTSMCKNLRNGLAKEADILQRLTYMPSADQDVMADLVSQINNERDSGKQEALINLVKTLQDWELEITAGERRKNAEEFFSDIEAMIRSRPKMFPILSKYYH